MRHFSSQKTVRLLIRRKVEGREQILLVHEKDERNQKDETGQGGKPGGWSLPGGGIKKSETEILKEIQNLLAAFVRISKEDGGDRPLTKKEYDAYYELFLDIPPFTELKIILTVVKEGVEETGLFIRPVRELVREDTPNGRNGHQTVLLDCEVLVGILQTHSIETDDARWFDVDDLPEGPLPNGLYKSHRPWIERGLEILRHPEWESQEDQQEEFM